MFGPFKWRRATQSAVRYCSTTLSGLEAAFGRSVPNQVFGDAYIAGFFQQLITHAILEVSGGKMPTANTYQSIASATYNQLVPGFGNVVMKAIPLLAEPKHAAHANYQVGLREGKEYIVALVSGDDETAAKLVRGFREFVARNYLGLKYPA